MSRRPAALAACLLLLAGAAASSGAPDPAALTAAASIEPGAIRVGDRARLTLTVDHPPGGELALPRLAQGKALVVLGEERRTVGLERGRERTTVRLEVTSYEPGEHPVRGTVVHAGPGGVRLEARLPPLALTTTSVLPSADTPPREIKGPARWPAPAVRRSALAAGVLPIAAAAAAFALARRRARRRAAPAAVAPVPARAPHETALQALAALRGRAPRGDEQIEPYYRELSGIVRRYVEARFGLRAPEQTTEEFLADAARSGRLPPEHQGTAREFLEQCDLVKFARHRPESGGVARALDAAEGLVRGTMQAAAR